jgi:hypothetical protein
MECLVVSRLFSECVWSVHNYTLADRQVDSRETMHFAAGAYTRAMNGKISSPSFDSFEQCYLTQRSSSCMHHRLCVLVADIVIVVLLERQAGPEQLDVGRVGRSEGIACTPLHVPARDDRRDGVTSGRGEYPRNPITLRRIRAESRDKLLELVVAGIGVHPLPSRCRSSCCMGLGGRGRQGVGVGSIQKQTLHAWGVRAKRCATSSWSATMCGRSSSRVVPKSCRLKWT